jgi:anion transporter
VHSAHAPWTIVLLLALCAAVIAASTPEGLPPAAQRVLAVAVLAIGLWCSEALPSSVTGLVLIVALVLTGAVPGLKQALSGFSEPVVYFLLGVLTIGLAVASSGLADRVAHFFLRRSRGNARSLYVQSLLAFPLLTLILPSATTRTGILVHVYEQALVMARVERRSPLASAVMMALNSINRLASTVLLTGGVTPMVAAALIGDFSWSRWFLLMSIPYLVLLVVGAVLIYVMYHEAFGATLPALPERNDGPLAPREKRILWIVGCAALLWLTDAFHHWHPAVAALLAWIVIPAPRVGVLSWSEFERNIGWSNLFVIASSCSLAHALWNSGASAWIAQGIVASVPQFADHPVLVIAVLLAASVPVRILVPNITGFLATTIPIAMAIGASTNVNPLVCALAVMIAGDAVLYYPAQSASSLVVYERGFLSMREIAWFGAVMTVVAFVVVLAVALPYWSFMGETLRRP